MIELFELDIDGADCLSCLDNIVDIIKIFILILTFVKKNKKILSIDNEKILIYKKNFSNFFLKSTMLDFNITYFNPKIEFYKNIFKIQNIVNNFPERQYCIVFCCDQFLPLEIFMINDILKKNKNVIIKIVSNKNLHFKNTKFIKYNKNFSKEDFLKIFSLE